MTAADANEPVPPAAQTTAITGVTNGQDVGFATTSASGQLQAVPQPAATPVGVAHNLTHQVYVTASHLSFGSSRAINTDVFTNLEAGFAGQSNQTFNVNVQTSDQETFVQQVVDEGSNQQLPGEQAQNPDRHEDLSIDVLAIDAVMSTPEFNHAHTEQTILETSTSEKQSSEENESDLSSSLGSFALLGSLFGFVKSDLALAPKAERRKRFPKPSV